MRRLLGAIGLGLSLALALTACGSNGTTGGTGTFLEPGTGTYPEPAPGAVDDGTIVPLNPADVYVTNRWVPIPDSYPNAQALVDTITVGWNLGNTLDSNVGRSPVAIRHNSPRGQEIHWGNPETTEELVLMVRDSGFNAIRIPVTWFAMVDEDLNIREDWLDRVQEVVDYAYNNGMIVILNTHHDESMWSLFDDGRDDAEQVIATMWRQIAARFEPYGQRLVFEGLNEPRTISSPAEWSGGTVEERANLNALQQVFVDTVRATCAANDPPAGRVYDQGYEPCEGTNNWNRFLVISPYAASATAAATEDLVIPADPAGDDKLIVSIHMYAPYEFALTAGNAVDTWSPDGSGASGPDAILDGLNRAHNLFVANGYPVIFGEMGAQNRNNTEARAAWAQFYVAEARARGIRTFWWDNGGIGMRLEGGGSDAFALFNRRTMAPSQPQIINSIMDAVDSTR